MASPPHDATSTPAGLKSRGADTTMAAPQIPNLLNRPTRGTRGRGAGRGRGLASLRGPRGPPGSQPTPQQPSSYQSRVRPQPQPNLRPSVLLNAYDNEEQRTRRDKLVQQTDNDASVSRISAVRAGYLEDPYACAFAIDDPGRRLPIINRGTYVRTTAIDKLIFEFVTSTPGPKQIISLGAGTDTRYFRMRASNQHDNILYHEIDYPSVSEQKLAAIRSSPILSPVGSSFYVLHSKLPEVKPRTERWGFFKKGNRSEGYLFHPCDLRTLGLDNTGKEYKKGQMVPFPFPGISRQVPTLLISECCLCYLSVFDADRVIGLFSSFIPKCGIVLYEPTLPETDFGKVMTQNLAMRGLSMPTVHSYPTFQSQMKRLKILGMSTIQGAADMDFIWENWVSTEEKERVNALEGLDEMEEWQLLARHYSVVWACREWGGDPITSFDNWEVNCLSMGPHQTHEDGELDGSDPSDDELDDGIKADDIDVDGEGNLLSELGSIYGDAIDTESELASVSEYDDEADLDYAPPQQ